MPILTLQRQMRELGRIRTGNQVASRNGRRPNKLETFRLTSESRELIEAAAVAFGGVVTPWDNNGSAEFEVITTRAAVDIVVPPGQPVSQWYEHWSAAGRLRRCVLDLTARSLDERLALAKEGEACKATTRLNVILPDLPDLGVWRLESHGYYAAVELAGAAEILAMASATGRLIPARLRLEQREKKIPGKPTNKYAVPIIEFVDTTIPYHLIASALEPGAGAQQIGPGTSAPRLGPGPRPSRPELPSVAPPQGSDFRAMPRQVGPGDDGEPVVVSASSPASAGATGARTPPETAAEPEPARSLTVDDLKGELERLGVDLQTALARSREMFPRGDTDPLTGVQRGALVVDLEASQSTAAL